MKFVFNEDSNLYGYNDEGSKNFEFPSNIKQMGCLEDDIRIYMEDYVYTYLYQYAKTNGGKEKVGVLVGKHQNINGQEVIIISGAIQSKASGNDKSIESFTEETWDYINDQMNKFFKGLSIVGWMHSQPGFGAFLMSKDEMFHRDCFTKKWQVLYVLDPAEKLDTFYVHNNENTGLRAAKGYFIYYDNKNSSMQDYMLENSFSKPKPNLNETIVFNENVDGDLHSKTIGIELEDKKPDRIDAAPKIRKILNNRAEEAEEAAKTRYAMLAGISGILCIACILMGASVISSQDRLNKLETELSSVKTSYLSMSEQLQKNTATVFAASQDSIPYENANAEPIANEVEPEKNKDTAASSADAALAEKTDSNDNAIKEEPKEGEPKEESTVTESTKEASTSSSGFDVSKLDAIPDYYVVEEGDNLGYISLKFYGTKEMMDTIMAANNLDDPDKIYFGKKLIMPKE